MRGGFIAALLALRQCKQGTNLTSIIQYLTFPAMTCQKYLWWIKTITVGLGWFSNWFDGKPNTGLDWLHQVSLQIVSSLFEWNKMWAHKWGNRQLWQFYFFFFYIYISKIFLKIAVVTFKVWAWEACKYLTIQALSENGGLKGFWISKGQEEGSSLY